MRNAIAAAVSLAALAVGAERLSLEQALRLAEQGHPQLAWAGAQVEGARAGVLTARAYPNPEAGVLAGQQRARVLGTVPGVVQVYNFAQPLETRAVRRTRIEAAELARVASEFGVSEARLMVRGAVRQSFYESLRRRAEVGLAEENLRLAEDLRRRIEVQVKVGEAARLELTRAEAEVAIARTSAQGARLRLATALAALRASMNAPPEADYEPVGELDSSTRLPELSVLRAEARANHPALRWAEAEVRRAEMRVRSEVAQKTPQPVLRSEYEHQPDVATYRVGVSLPVPVWNKRAGPIAEAEAGLKSARWAVAARGLEIQAALENAYRRYQVASQQLAVYEEGVLKQAESALRAAEAAYRFGERGILEVLDAQRVLRAARLDFLNAQYDRQAALIDVEQLRAAGASGENR